MSATFLPFRIGTRGSPLALAQTEIVRAKLESQHPGLPVEIVRITTKGDLIIDRPLAAVGDKGLFVAEIEEALQSGRIDCAVHSAKDLPSELTSGMILTAFLERADPRDVLVTLNAGASIDTLPQGARVGTGSPRRVCQLRARRADLQILDIRGNVDTRLRKLVAHEYDALILAAAGLDRLGVHEFHMTRLDSDVMVPAVGQGAIAIEIHEGNTRAQELLAPLDHAATSTAVRIERAFLAAVGGGCHAAMGAYATINTTPSDMTTVHIRGMIGTVEGHRAVDTRIAPFDPALTAAFAVVDDLVAELKSRTNDSPSAQSSSDIGINSEPRE